MILRPDQAVNDLVHFNSVDTTPDHTPNLDTYAGPALAVDSANQSNTPAAKTKE